MKMDFSKFDKNGKLKNGLWTRYHENGNLMDETEFINGKKIGAMKKYDIQGELLK